jgi:hypothetical protein
MSAVSTLRNDWPLAVMVAGSAATVAVVVACVIAVTVFGRGSMTFMAAAFACFSLVKLAVAVKGLRELRRFTQAERRVADQVAAGATPDAALPDDPRIDQGGPANFRRYIIMKLLAATLAMFAAVFILVHGPGAAWANGDHAPPPSAR